MNRYLIIIPAYNAAQTLPGLIDKIRSSNSKIDIAIINDGSTDNTTDFASQKDTILLNHENNQGKGEALKTGFQYAIDNSYDALITIDADLQHDPHEIDNFIKHYQNRGGIVIGVRTITQSMPFPRRISNSLSTFMTSLFAGRKLKDSQSGYRMIPVDFLKRTGFISKQFELEAEQLIRAARMNISISYIPIKTIYNSSTSSIKPLKDSIRFLIMLFRSLLW